MEHWLALLDIYCILALIVIRSELGHFVRATF